MPAHSVIAQAAAKTALAQSRAAAQVRLSLRERGVTLDHVAQACGFSDRHLRRLLTGEVWARTTDLVALSMACSADLVLFPGDPDDSGKRPVVRTAIPDMPILQDRDEG